MRLRAAVAVALVAGILAGSACSGGGDGGGRGDGGGGRSAESGAEPVRSGPAVELRVLGGSELADMQPILDDAAEATGVTVTFEFTGTLTGAERVVSGEADGAFDALWFPSNRYLGLHPESEGLLRREERVMTSPVVLGLSSPVARDLGWDAGAGVTWADVAEAAAAGEFSYGMTNPAESNSGFSALVGVTAALADTGAALELDDIEAVEDDVRGFFSAQELAAGSSGWLAETFAARAAGTEPGVAVDGLVNYESVLLMLNDGTLDEPLTIVRPRDGVVTADYPLSLLDSASDEAADGYGRLVDYLLRPEVQARIVERTHRRPVTRDVPVGDDFGDAELVELPFPARLEVVDRLVATYFDRLRRPARTVYVLDVSGSMEGERIASLRTALAGLTGADETLTSKARRFASREEVTLLPFDTLPRAPQPFAVPEAGAEADAARSRIRSAAEALSVGGDTAVYDGLGAAYDVLAAAPDGEYATSIVLMTDGENNTGTTYQDFVTRHGTLPEPLRDVPVFTVLFGESNVVEMQQVADLTGGESFDARGDGLVAAFEEIRGYQ